MGEFFVKIPFILRQFMDYGGNKVKKNKSNENFLKTDLKCEVKNSSVKVNENGLSNQEASRRLKKDFKNCLVSQINISAMKIFAGQFKDFLVLILLVATAVSLFMGEITEVVLVFTILFLNAFMGFVQKFKIEKTDASFL